MFTKENYFDYYVRNGKCVDQINKPKNPLNLKQLSTKYGKYVKKEEKKKNKKIFSEDPKWDKLKEIVFKRDENTCQFMKTLKYNNYLLLRQTAGYLMATNDPAHVFGKGSHPHMKYCIDNVVTLNRWSHSCLDSSKHPITGELISAKEVYHWWTLIVGSEEYKVLKRKSFDRGTTYDDIS